MRALVSIVGRKAVAYYETLQGDSIGSATEGSDLKKSAT